MNTSDNTPDSSSVSSSILEASEGAWAALGTEAKEHGAALARACEDRDPAKVASLIFSEKILLADMLQEFAVECGTALGAEIVPHLLKHIKPMKRAIETSDDFEEEDLEGVSVSFDIIENLGSSSREVDETLFWFLEEASGEYPSGVYLGDIADEAGNTILAIGKPEYAQMLKDFCHRRAILAPEFLARFLGNDALPFFLEIIQEYDFEENPYDTFMVGVLSAFRFFDCNEATDELERLSENEAVRKNRDFTDAIGSVLLENVPGMLRAISRIREEMKAVAKIHRDIGTDPLRTRRLLRSLVDEVLGKKS
jgi:hypothetical protein